MVPGPGVAWLETLVPVQYAAYPLRDTTGRPLGELNAPPWARASLEAELVACPYADSRAGIPMNLTALRHVGSHWPWVLASLRTLRSAWAALRPEADPSSPAELWSFATATMAMPTFLVRRGAVGDGTVPAELSGLYKVTQGLYLATWRRWMTRTEGEPIDPDSLLALVDATGLLHNAPSERVCPAPRPMLRELFAASLGPVTDLGPDLGSAEPTLRYGAAYAALTLEKWLQVGSAPLTAVRAAERQRDALAGWSEAPAAAEDRFTELQRAVCLACGVPGPTERFDLRWIPPHAKA